MMQAERHNGQEVEQIYTRLAALRQSFDSDIACPPPQEARSAEDHLLLSLSGELYAYPVRCALEIIPVPRIVPVPEVPPAVLGIINFRGQILSVTTIHGVLGLTAEGGGPTSRIVVTKGIPLATGILVDGVEGITSIVIEDIQPPSLTMGWRKSQPLLGQLYLNGQLVSCLDVEQLCASAALQVRGTGAAG